MCKSYWMILVSSFSVCISSSVFVFCSSVPAPVLGRYLFSLSRLSSILLFPCSLLLCSSTSLLSLGTVEALTVYYSDSASPFSLILLPCFSSLSSPSFCLILFYLRLFCFSHISCFLSPFVFLSLISLFPLPY